MKAAAFALLFLASLPARAEWIPVGEGNEIYAAYADPSTLRREGPFVRLSALYDFKRRDQTPEGRSMYSSVVLREFDCDARKVRLLSFIDFGGQMGQGEAVASDAGVRHWEDIVPGALDEQFWRFACRQGL